MRTTRTLVYLAAMIAIAGTSQSSAAEWGLKKGTPAVKTAGPLTFGPDGILFVGDTKSAAVFAIDTGDRDGKSDSETGNVAKVNHRIAASLDVQPGDLTINDLAVNPLTRNTFVSVTLGSGSEAQPAIVSISTSGAISRLSLEDVSWSKAALPDPPEDKIVQRGRRKSNARDDSITDLAYVDGRVIVSGLSAKSSPSSVREFAFPFVETDKGFSVEIFHGAHGKYEDYSAIRTFVPFNIGGKPNLLAAYVCTPLVRFPLDSLKPGDVTRGVTVAELGNRNRPLDMIVYEKDGSDYLLLINSARGVMKIGTEEIANASITERVADTAGQSYTTIEEFKNVVQLDRLDESHAVILVADGTDQHLKTIALP